MIIKNCLNEEIEYRNVREYVNHKLLDLYEPNQNQIVDSLGRMLQVFHDKNILSSEEVVKIVEGRNYND